MPHPKRVSILRCRAVSTTRIRLYNIAVLPEFFLQLNFLLQLSLLARRLQVRLDHIVYDSTMFSLQILNIYGHHTLMIHDVRLCIIN